MLASKCNHSTYNVVIKNVSFLAKNWKCKLPNQIVLNPDFSKLPGVNKIALRNQRAGKIGGKITENYNLENLDYFVGAQIWLCKRPIMIISSLTY